MIFTDPAFLFVFLPALLVGYAVAPARLRNLLLTLFSVLYYAVGEWQFLPWLLASTALNYVVARGLAAWRGTPRGTALLAFGIASDLALLVVFKYGGFFTSSVNAVLAAAHLPTLPVPSLALPLGISFFTFHKISYKVDVVRGVAEARRNPLDLLLYITLFPQLIAGPIVRYHDIASELVRRTITRVDVVEGARRFAIGLGKKVLIANTVAVAADGIFAVPGHSLSAQVAWLGALCYAIQIYFDFSGYSDMAIGLARMFGFHFLENFHYPYAAQSITDFWRRWHISLSRWFRDYLYIPLGGNRISTWRTYVNLVVVFFLCGLWHGAQWTFVVWGLFHGLVLVIERLGLRRVLQRLPSPVRHAYTLGSILIGWVLFRAPSLENARGFLGAMVGYGSGSQIHTVARYVDAKIAIAMAVACIGALPALPRLQDVLRRLRTGAGRSAAALDGGIVTIGHASLVGVLVLALCQIATGTYNPFIYFRF